MKNSEQLFTPQVSEEVCQDYEIVPTDEAIPVERLTPENPILFFQDITFYEDELDDFGKMEYRIRFRVMEDCCFGLMRCYLRNDEVIIRSLDTRIFIDFSKDYVLREFSVREASYAEIKEKGFKFTPQFNNDESQVDSIQPLLDIKKVVRDKILIKKKQTA